MKRDNDSDLAEAFRSMKDEDLNLVPANVTTGAVTRRWRLGASAYAIGLCAVLVFGFFLLSTQRQGDAPRMQTPSIAFDEMADVISREMFVASASNWESPTSFLLQPNFRSTTKTTLEK